MFRKTRLEVPEEAFIAKPARIFAILHLCLVFTMICWIASWPFTGKMLEDKKKIYIFQSIIGSGELINRTYEDAESQAKLSRNHVRFAGLPSETKYTLLNAYEKLIESKNTETFLEKCCSSLEHLLLKSSPWVRAWLLLGLIAAIALLKKSPGASYALCLLPFITACWIYEASLTPKHASRDALLFPSESYLIERYLDEPFSSKILEQQKQLQSAWDRYLASEWSPSGDTEEGEWRFQLARLEITLNEKEGTDAATSVLPLYLLCGWSCLFAFIAIKLSKPQFRQNSQLQPAS